MKFKTWSETEAGGFTLFGDPAQGIYNYQLEGEARRICSAVLYEWIRAHSGPRLEEPGSGGGPESGVTSLAGFEIAGGAAPASGVTPLADLAGGWRPQVPGGRIATPAAFK